MQCRFLQLIIFPQLLHLSGSVLMGIIDHDSPCCLQSRLLHYIFQITFSVRDHLPLLHCDCRVHQLVPCKLHMQRIWIICSWWLYLIFSFVFSLECFSHVFCDLKWLYAFCCWLSLITQIIKYQAQVSFVILQDFQVKVPNMLGRGERFSLDYTLGTKKTHGYSAYFRKPLNNNPDIL